MGKLIIVRHEHPLEASSGKVAKSIYDLLQQQGFDVSMVLIRGEYKPVVGRGGMLNLEATTRPETRTDETVKIAAANKGSLVISFHNKDNQGGPSDPMQRFLHGGKYENLFDPGCGGPAKKAFCVKISLSRKNLFALEIATQGSAARWQKPFLGFPPHKIDTRSQAQKDGWASLPVQVYSIPMARRDGILSARFVSVLARKIIEFAEHEGFPVSRTAARRRPAGARKSAKRRRRPRRSP